MSRKVTFVVPQQEIEKQYNYMQSIKDAMAVKFMGKDCKPKAVVRTFGCQMNEHDSEKIAGMIRTMGYELISEENFTDQKQTCELVVFNTCCVRENAEEKVYGHLGAMKADKRNNPEMVIAVCGCMVEQPHVVQEIKQKYKNVDLVFGTHNLHRFPELLHGCITDKRRIYEVSHTEGEVAENLPVERSGNIKAWVTIMYGCDNFCTYCIVPYVRGRERSRRPEDIIKEIKGLTESGVQEITLLGQNVNSYGKDLDIECPFPELLRKICEETSIARIRFMTSHPKDISSDLIKVMAEYPAICDQLHLPVQSGSSEILKRMNRHYTREQYLDLIKQADEMIPGLAKTTDIIVGFPGETEEDFLQTLDLVKKVRYDMAFTFIYSQRVGTPAAKYPDQVPEEVVKDRFNRLLEVQNAISREINEAFLNSEVEVLVEGMSRTDLTKFTGRTGGNKIVNFTYDGQENIIGGTVKVLIDHIQTWSLEGKLVSILKLRRDS